MNTQLDFFNTIHLSGEALKEALAQCNNQAERILKILSNGKPKTPAEVHGVYQSHYANTPITSIRRAITNLTINGELEKLEEMKEGNYGKPNHKWKIKITDVQRQRT